MPTTRHKAKRKSAWERATAAQKRKWESKDREDAAKLAKKRLGK